MIQRSLPFTPAAPSTGRSTSVRATNATAANRERTDARDLDPVQMSEVPNATKVSSRNISAEASP